MKVIVCGAGQVGYNIARHLAEQQNDVTVIDQSPQLIRKIMEGLDVQAIVGHAADPTILSNAGMSDADLLVAVTQSDEVNMVACQVAKALFNVPKNVARIRNQSYLKAKWADLFTRENMAIDVIISPEVEVAEALWRRLEVPGAFNMIPFTKDKVRVIGMHLDENCPVIDTPLRQLTELFPNLNITVMTIVREDRVFIPSAEDHLQIGDDIYIGLASENTARTMAVFGHQEKEARRISIVGGGNVGLNLATILEERNPSVVTKLIELDEEHARAVAEKLKTTIVLNGDALDREILLEANISETDTIVAVADDDEVNILTSLLSKREGCQRAITLVNNPIYGPLLGSLGIDVALDPRETTVSTILQHIRRGRIRALHSIRSGRAEIIEAEVMESSPLAGKKLGDMKHQSNIRVGMIVRNNEVFSPRPTTVFETGDSVIMIALADSVKDVEQLFSARADFF